MLAILGRFAAIAMGRIISEPIVRTQITEIEVRKGCFILPPLVSEALRSLVIHGALIKPLAQNAAE